MTAQRLLFDELPETERVRKPARRSRAATVAAPVAVDVIREAVPAPLPESLQPGRRPPTSATMASATMASTAMASATMAMVLVPPAPVPPPAFEPEALTNPELRALVQAIPDQRLAFLLVEAARELRRRVAPNREDEMEGGAEDGGGGTGGPNPALLRAARQVVGELSGED